MTTAPFRLAVSEIFYSLQGEGGRSGEASLFIRLQGCTAKHACAASGVVCDTEFESGKIFDLDSLNVQLLQAIYRIAPQYVEGTIKPWIIWTGGEPLDQLTVEILETFRHFGYKRHAIETSGVVPMSLDLAKALDWITVSPKVAEHILVKHFPWTDERPLNELRYVRHAGQPGVPRPSVKALNYFLSPHSDGFTINKANVAYCTNLCLEHPMWKLSIQSHKLLVIL